MRPNSDHEHPGQDHPACPGKRVGHYELLAELGRGGMGVVFRGRDLQLGREVALKCPWPKFAADKHHRRRFLREARASSLVSHPNIVQVHEAFEHEGLPWLVLQLIDGQNLQSVLASEGKLPVGAILKYGEQLASALQAAHARKILHRDIKPTNILITSDSRAMLTDFGLARFLAPAYEASQVTTELSSTTAEGVILGTPRYMSPEQVRGKPLDPRSDIFSLGTVLYEMCTGVPAFSASTRGGLYDAITQTEPEPIPQYTYEIPAELERIIRKSMSKLPGERYQNAKELLVDLRALRRQEDFKEYSASHPRETSVPAKKLSQPLVLAAVAIALCALIVLWLSTRDGVHHPLPRGQPRQVTSTEAWEGEPALSPDGSRIAYASTESGNSDIYIIDARGGNPLQLTEHPAADYDPAWFPDGHALAFASDRGERTSIWKVGQLGGGAILLLQDARYPAISPDGSRIAFSRTTRLGDYRIGVAPISDPTQVTMLTGDDDGLWDHRHPAWSRDGRLICYSTQHDLWVVPATSGNPRRLTAQGGLDQHPVWSSTGDFVYFSSHREGTLALWRVDITTGSSERITMGTGSECQPSICRDGSRLAYGVQTTSEILVIRDLDSGMETALVNLRDTYLAAMAPDRSRVIFATRRSGSEFALWEQALDEGTPSGPPRQLTDHPGNASHPALSPDGQWIAYYRIIEEQRDIWILPASGGQPIRFTEHPAPDIHPAWSADGSTLAFVSERAGTYDIWIAPVCDGHRSGPAQRLTTGRIGAYAPAWSPDGKMIAFVGSYDDQTDVMVIPVSGNGSARQVTTGASAKRVRWDSSTGTILASGLWGADRFTLRRISPDGGTTMALDPPIILGSRIAPATFDVSADGRLLVFSRKDLTGDIWVLEAEDGVY